MVKKNKVYKKKVTKGKYLIKFNDNILGEAVMDVDGYFYLVFKNPTDGTWASWVLRAISDLLDELNKPWDDHITEYFKNNPE